MWLLLDAAYCVAGLVTAPWWLPRLIISRRFRTGLGERLGYMRSRPPARRIWIHCASVGELNAARTFIDAIPRRFSDWDWVISCYTPTGRELARQRYGSERVFLFPLDLSWIVRRTLRRIKPSVLVLMELEFWPNLLLAARHERLPVLLINGRMEERSLRRWRRFGFVLKKVLDETTPNRYCIQNGVYAERFRSLGVPASRMLVTGTMKYDAVRTEVPASERERLRHALGLGADELLIVGGSTWPGEEEALLASYRALRAKIPGMRLLLAPRHIERAEEVARLIVRAGFTCARRSSSAPAARGSVLLLDTLGELTTAYALATCAFVGKTLCVGGGHNVLEPAALGVPVLFGPLTQTCAVEAALLVERGAARRVADAGELTTALETLLADPATRAAMGKHGRAVVREHQGATERHLAVLGEMLVEYAGQNRPLDESLVGYRAGLCST